MTNRPGDARLFRVWMVGYGDWQPTGCLDVPPRAEVLELAENDCLSEPDARRYVESFNRAMLDHGERVERRLDRGNRLWALAVPVSVRYEGDLAPGVIVQGADSPFA